MTFLYLLLLLVASEEVASQNEPLRVSAHTAFMFAERGGVVERILAAKQAGFNAVDVDIADNTVEEIATVIKNENLTLAIVDIAHGEEFGRAATPGEEDLFKADLQKTIEVMNATNCKKVHIFNGLNVDDFEVQKATLISNMKYAATELDKIGGIALLEPIDPLPNYFLKSFDTAVEVIEAVQAPNIKIMVDFFHLQMLAGNITHNMERLKLYTAHYQSLGNAPHRYEIGYPGEMDFKYIFNEVKKQGYDDYFSLEYSPSTPTTEETLSFMEEYGVVF